MAVTYMTEEGLKKLKEELQFLETVERPRIIAAIAEAREKGDLSENAEYDAAKEEQGILESKIAQNKSLYYDALELCQRGWMENEEDPTPFIKYLLQTILAAYRDFEDRVALVDEKLPAIETVRRTVYNRIGKFTKSEVMELCPMLSKASVESAIKQLVEQGLLVKHGSGRITFYTRSDAQ